MLTYWQRLPRIARLAEHVPSPLNALDGEGSGIGASLPTLTQPD
jgi:hypothetical protein